MICPLCKTVYPDDFLFCLTDGNTLVENSVEQETALNPNVRLSMPGGVLCPACGFSSEANSAFCENCGIAVRHEPPTQPFIIGNASDIPPTQIGYPIPPQNVPPVNQPYGETIGFVPPVFTPPVQPVIAPPSKSKNVLIITLAALSIVLFAGIVYMMSGGAFKTDGNQQTLLNNANSASFNSGSVTNTTAGAGKNTTKISNVPVSDEPAPEKTKNDVPTLPERFDREYRGYSNRPLTLLLKKDGYSLSGTAKTPGDWDALQGTIEPDGTFDLAGNNQGYGITGHWRGRIYPDGSIRGVWTATTGRRVSYSATTVR